MKVEPIEIQVGAKILLDDREAAELKGEINYAINQDKHYNLPKLRELEASLNKAGIIFKG